MDEEEKKNSEEKNEPVEGTVIEETVQEETKEEVKKEKSKISEEAENIKNETKETVNKVKDTIKNTDFKKDANETTSFVKDMFSNPIDAVKRAASEENIIGKVIILMMVFIVANVIGTIISLLKYSELFSLGHNLLRFILSFLRPVVAVLVPSIVIFLFNRENKKKLTTVISTVVVAYIPRIINSILLILDLLIAKITLVTTPIETALVAVSMILGYFGVKELFGKDDNTEMLKKYAIILFISELVLVVLNEIGIY
jgi:hypothetical protein